MDQIEYYCDLVWLDSTFGDNTPNYFEIFVVAPTHTAELNMLKNHRRLRHIIMGNKIWNSLNYQVKIKYWDFIQRRVNPSTTVGASMIKKWIIKVVHASQAP